MIFISDLPWASMLSETFRTRIEEFLPVWLESLIPYYKEGKKQGVDYLSLANIDPISPAEKRYISDDGIAYYLSKQGGIKHLAFDVEKGYRKCNWLECFQQFCPEYDRTSSYAIMDLMYYNPNFSRCFNHLPEHRELADRCNAYFQNLTGDNAGGFSLSSTSMIYFTDMGRNYIKNYCKRY